MNLKLRKVLREKEKELFKKMSSDQKEHYIRALSHFNRTKLILFTYLDSIETQSESYECVKDWYKKHITSKKKFDKLTRLLDNLDRIRLLQKSVKEPTDETDSATS